MPTEMKAEVGPKDHPPVLSEKIGVLLVNLGTPDGTDYWSMRRYLKEFLSDHRVVEVPRIIWFFILNLFILTFRPKKSGQAYEKIWNKDVNESPLRTITRAQADALAALDEFKDADICVDWAMRYGNPSISEKLGGLKEKGCDRMLVFPLYPQYSASTTATVFDKTAQAMAALRWQPTLRFAAPYYKNHSYITALAVSLKAGLEKLAFTPDAVLVSFHGVPKRYLLAGDPYHCHCHTTTRLLREELGWSENYLRLSFQSRFGADEWLQPYTDETLKALPAEGIRNLAVIMPGFAADCLETLEEIAIGGEKTFKAAGGEHLAAIPCLNDHSNGITMLAGIIRQELGGWHGQA